MLVFKIYFKSKATELAEGLLGERKKVKTDFWVVSLINQVNGGTNNGEGGKSRGKIRGLVWGILNLRCLLALLVQMSSGQLDI